MPCRAVAAAVGLAKGGDSLSLAGAELQAHRSPTTCKLSAALVMPT